MAVVCLKGCLLNLSRNGVFGDLSNFDFSIFHFLLWCALVGWFFVVVFFFLPCWDVERAVSNTSSNLFPGADKLGYKYILAAEGWSEQRNDLFWVLHLLMWVRVILLGVWIASF